MSFISELKRRNVIRMAGLYLVGAWLLTQVSATVLPLFSAPIWMPRGIVIDVNRTAAGQCETVVTEAGDLQLNIANATRR